MMPGLPSSEAKSVTAPWPRPIRTAPSGVAAAIVSVRSRPGRRCVQGAGSTQTPAPELGCGQTVVIAGQQEPAQIAFTRDGAQGMPQGFGRGGGFRVMGIITWSSRCQIARCMLMRNAPRPQGNGCSRRRSPVGQSADPRSRLTSRHTARRCCMTTCPEPWLGPLGFTRPACDSREIWRFKFPRSDSRLVLAP